MSLRILITGFGPFAGFHFNPTQVLAAELVRRPHPAFARVIRRSHVFPVSYQAVDHDLPKLIANETPDALIMFGLAGRTKELRIETCARNGRSRLMPDISGYLPAKGRIDPTGPPIVPLRSPVKRLLMAVQSTGLPAVLSRDAGRYLCNYLCWRAADAARNGGPRLVTFIHVPAVHGAHIRRRNARAFTLDDLMQAGEAILRAVVAARPQSLPSTSC
jgi:pyroglutamyl-peptidase